MGLTEMIVWVIAAFFAICGFFTLIDMIRKLRGYFKPKE